MFSIIFLSKAAIFNDVWKWKLFTMDVIAFRITWEAIKNEFLISCANFFFSLAAQREQYLKDKAEAQEQYKRALSAQVGPSKLF